MWLRRTQLNTSFLGRILTVHYGLYSWLIKYLTDNCYLTFTSGRSRKATPFHQSLIVDPVMTLQQLVWTLRQDNCCSIVKSVSHWEQASSPLFQFGDAYLLKLSLPINLYLAASMHGLWNSCQYAKACLLPFLFCSNRTVYARHMPYMVLRMNRHLDALTECFQKGKFGKTEQGSIQL